MTFAHKQPRVDARRNREAVIDASLELLADEPNATMSAIAELSGVGRTTLYRHFPSREDLVRALFERVVAEARQVTEEVASRDSPASEILCELGPAIVGIGRRFQFLEGLRSLGDVVIEESVVDPNQPLRTYFEAAQKRGEVRGDVPVQWILSSMNGLAMTAMGELRAGRIDEEGAGELLGLTLSRAFAVGSEAS